MKLMRNILVVLFVAIAITSCDLLQNKKSEKVGQSTKTETFDVKRLACDCVYGNDQGLFLDIDSIRSILPNGDVDAFEQELETLKAAIIVEAETLAAKVDQANAEDIANIQSAKQTFINSLAPEFGEIYKKSFEEAVLKSVNDNTHF